MTVLNMTKVGFWYSEFFGDEGGAVYINHNSGSRLLFSECEFVTSKSLGHLCTLLSCRLQLYGYKVITNTSQSTTRLHKLHNHWATVVTTTTIQSIPLGYITYNCHDLQISTVNAMKRNLLWNLPHTVCQP